MSTPNTYLLRSEAIELLQTKGLLRVTEARRALERIPRAKLRGEFRKWHYLDVEQYAADIRAGKNPSFTPGNGEGGQVEEEEEVDDG